MPRPTHKYELIQLAEIRFLSIMSLIESLSDQEKLGLFPFSGRDRQIRDCVIHLYEWHLLFIHWFETNIKKHLILLLFYPNLILGKRILV